MPATISSISSSAFYKTETTIYYEIGSTVAQRDYSGKLTWKPCEVEKITAVGKTSNPTVIEGADEKAITSQFRFLGYDCYGNNIETIDIDLIKCTVDTSKTGKATATFYYGEYSTTAEVTVTSKSLIGISVYSLPTKTLYHENTDELNLSGGKIELLYDNNTTSVIELSEAVVTGFDNSKVGTQTLSVSYEGFTTTFEIIISNKSLTGIEITKIPRKHDYKAFKEFLNVIGGEITLYYDNSTSETIKMTKEMISGFDNKVIGNQKLTVSYNNQTTYFYINVFSNPPLEHIFDSENNTINIIGDSVQVRSKGASRYDTARVTADNLKLALDVDKFDTIIIACGTNFPDALAGSYLAAKKSAPIIIVGGGASAAGAADAVNYVSANLASGGMVYILGGTGAVAQSVEDSLKALDNATFDLTVTRLKDTDRYGTNMKILTEAGLDGVNTLLICDGAGFADALSASALGLPILLINKKSGALTQAQKDYIKSGGFDKIYILGGTGAVPESIKTDVQGVSTATIKRLSGKGRYETSIAIANEFFATADCITIATGANFPDGLTGGSLAYALEAPLILTTNTEAAIGLANGFAKDKTVNKVLTFGGTAAIKAETVSSIMAK